MRVTVKFFTTLREITGKKEEAVELPESATLNDLLKKLSQKHGSAFSNYIYGKGIKRVDPSLQFLINGISASTLQDVGTKLKNGDIVAIIPPVGGG